ncbi:MAG: hypothetical protein NC185_04730 [Ruminococcus sp.]|nr:hypothetical protein [Ruminococcus sp.]
MKKFLCIVITIIMMFGLCACTQSEFIELDTFIESYNKYQTEQPLNFTDLMITTDGEQTIYNCFFPCETTSVTVRIIAHENKKIEQCRIIIPKLDEKGKQLNLTDEMLSLFVKTTENTICAFTSCMHDEAAELVGEFTLNESETFSNQGELTKIKGSFYYVYLSNTLVSEFIIYNKWLHEIESTSKPVSKIAYADTTKVREETIPLQ